MTVTTKTPAPTNPSTITQNDGQGFQPIPTRIRDMREAGGQPLVVDSETSKENALICENLNELGLKLAEIHRTAAEAYMSQDLYEQALPHLEAASTFSPSEVDFRMQLGFVQYITGDDAGAIKSFNQIISEDENNDEAWFNLGMVVFGQEQYTEAEYCFRRASELEADDAQTWNNRGVCLWKLERSDEARTCFANALKLDPSDEDAKYNLETLK
ncbi:tetratricopeptide repeat protein [bacterium]|nr:tetratricopeptide repeat protein [bacterium]